MKILIIYLTALCFSSSIQLAQDDVKQMDTAEENLFQFEPINTADVSINNFGFTLLKEMMKQNENRNIVISPTGIAGILAMTLLGSTGKTYEELARVIGFSQDILKNRELHEEFGTLLQSLNKMEEQTQTLYANAIFVDERSKLRDAYHSYLERVYKGEAFNADFGHTDEAKDTINQWVKNHTNNKIENFLQQPLPINTKAVLLNALYFSGQWAHPFVPEHTKELPFKTPTKEVLVNLMANFGQFNYLFSIENGLHMIQFPYNDSETSMYVIKPRFPKITLLADLLDRLNYEQIDRLISQMSMKKCVVRFPKMEVKSRVDLKDALKDLGVRTMFTPGAANFAIMLEAGEFENDTEDNLIKRINDGDVESKTLKEMVDQLANPGVHVDSVLHEVKLNVDEFGTEAVAATSAIMARSAESFYADTPFYMFIRNDKTKLVTFSAVIYDPTE